MSLGRLENRLGALLAAATFTAVVASSGDARADGLTPVSPTGKGIVGGALVGGLLGKAAGLSIDKKFVEDVKEALQPGNSGIILVTSKGVPDAVINALEPYKGKLFSTSLDSDIEKQLRQALE